MGKVRSDHIKNLARKLVERFPRRFNSDFENNKMMVDKLTDVSSIKIRNRVAGYIVHLKNIGSDSAQLLQKNA
jgi:small subunit ribosomal protein S17e